MPGVGLVCLLSGCGIRPAGADWPPLGKKWFDRAQVSFRNCDIEDAQYAVDNALRVAGTRKEVRLLASSIALAQLEFDRAVQLLQTVEGAEARGVRGRALWYSGKVESAADELEQLTSDPDVRDPWAVEVAKLARRGSGRKPFELSGGLLAVSEMPQVGSSALIVPLEINGEPGLGMVATGTAEAVVDTGGGGEASWVSLRFGERIEVKDVPALAHDLSGISGQINAPIKMLLGVNLLRHLHPTIDLTGGQFVVRTFEPPPPPFATTVRVAYLRGGGMLMRGAFGADQTAPAASLLIDTSMSFPLALDEQGWKKAGISTKSLPKMGESGALRQGTLPVLRIGAFELPRVAGVYGAPVADIEKGLNVDLDGLVGSGLLAAFRVTLRDRGLTMWLEPPPLANEPPPPALEAPQKPAPPAASPARKPG
ncbi:MAG TPA: hypothetical protein VGJ84_00175, partial [Polyangiaceae bacterium]